MVLLFCVQKKLIDIKKDFSVIELTHHFLKTISLWKLLGERLDDQTDSCYDITLGY